MGAAKATRLPPWRARRRAAGLMQAEAAARCGLTVALWNAYERGRTLPSWATVCRLVKLFGPGLLAGE